MTFWSRFAGSLPPWRVYICEVCLVVNKFWVKSAATMPGVLSWLLLFKKERFFSCDFALSPAEPIILERESFDAIMGLRCNMCLSVFANLSLLLNHWLRVHGQDPNLDIVCGVGDVDAHTKIFSGTEATYRETIMICGKMRRRSLNWVTWWMTGTMKNALWRLWRYHNQWW